jgi:hypothetical protein
VLATLLVGAVLAHAAPAGAQAGGPPRRSMLGGAKAGAPKPRLLRADSPFGTFPPTLPDPAIASEFDAVRDGINLNGVGVLEVAAPDGPGFYYCTMQRIAPRTILTAAHCVTDDATGSVFSTAYGASAYFRGPGGGFQQFTAASAHVRPDWFGFSNQNTLLGGDVAVLNFADELPSWVTTYDLSADLLAPGTAFDRLASTHVGYGTYGTGVGPTEFGDFNRRWGQNYVDVIGFAGDRDEGVLYNDFQDAAGNWGTICVVVGVCNPTRGPTEAGGGPGDSGGPLFINGRLAGITSFGWYFCDPFATGDECVPFVADPSRPYDSFGSLGGFAPVAYNLQFIASATVPEPGTVLLVGGGLLVVVVAARRRGRAA